MQKSHTHNTWITALIIILIIVFTAWLITEPTATRQDSTSDDYTQELQRISNNLARCIENSENIPTKQSDPLEGTNYSRENRARNDREECQRKYNLQKRALEIKQNSN